MPANLRPLQPVAAPVVPWIVPNLMPTCDVVFVDGVSGVGKSMFCAHFAAAYAGEPELISKHRILYITSKNQADERDSHLRQQRTNLDMLLEAPFESLPNLDGTPDPMLVFNFIDHIRDQLKSQAALFVIIDDLEELLEPAGPIDPMMMKRLWIELKSMASHYGTTFIIPRRHGLHENRSYGVYTKTGNDAIRFILTVQYHPFDPSQRVVTVAKNLRGPAGVQWLFQFDETGHLFGTRAEPHLEVQPSNKHRTWAPDHRETRNDSSFMETICDKFEGKPVTRDQMLEHAKEQGYSATQFRQHLSRLKLKKTRQGNTHLYQPNYAMLEYVRQAKKPMKPSAPTTPHDVSQLSVAPQAA